MSVYGSTREKRDMVAFIETYDMLGSKYSIEDLEDGRPMEEHFMGGDARQRFSCWVGGCGIGQFDTLEEARTRIRDHVLREARKKRGDAILAQQASASVIKVLGAGYLSSLNGFREVTGVVCSQELGDAAVEEGDGNTVDNSSSSMFGVMAALRKTVLKRDRRIEGFEDAIKARRSWTRPPTSGSSTWPRVPSQSWRDEESYDSAVWHGLSSCAFLCRPNIGNSVWGFCQLDCWPILFRNNTQYYITNGCGSNFYVAARCVSRLCWGLLQNFGIDQMTNPLMLAEKVLKSAAKELCFEGSELEITLAQAVMDKHAEINRLREDVTEIPTLIRRERRRAESKLSAMRDVVEAAKLAAAQSRPRPAIIGLREALSRLEKTDG